MFACIQWSLNLEQSGFRLNRGLCLLGLVFTCIMWSVLAVVFENMKGDICLNRVSILACSGLHLNTVVFVCIQGPLLA